jgi:hypothetical protein
VQPRLITVAALRGVMAPDAFATVRAVTYMHDRRSTLMAALLKIVVEGNVVDNFGHGTTGNLLAPLDPLTGTLTAVRGSRSRTFPVIFDLDTHPTTENRLVGVQVPRWSDVLSLVHRAQACFAGLRTTAAFPLAWIKQRAGKERRAARIAGCCERMTAHERKHLK